MTCRRPPSAADGFVAARWLAPHDAVVAAPPAPAEDEALSLVRLRYARGEIDRDQYLETQAVLRNRDLVTKSHYVRNAQHGGSELT